jgi:hypothetical protein
VELCSGHHRLLHEGGYGLRVTDDGALVFTRPDGERIPDVPRPLVLTGDPVAVLVAGNHRHDVSAETFRCQWDGARPDYGTMVQLLDDYSRAGTPVNSSLNATSRARALASKGCESLGAVGLPST